MNNLHLVLACKALDRLSDQSMNIRNSYKVMKLQQRLRPLFNLYSRSESKIIEELGLADKMEGSTIKFGNDEETLAKYTEMHAQLDEMDAEFDSSWAIKLDPQENLKVSPRDMELLCEMIDFGFEEKEEAKEDEQLS